MKICLLASAGSVHVAKWANHFCRGGHSVDILSFEPADSIDAKVRIHRLGKPQPMKAHYFTHGGVVRRLLQKIRPDILHAHYCSGYGTLGRLANFHPYVLSVWGSDVFDFPKKSALHRALIQANLKSADRVCSTSQIMADEVRRCRRQEVTVTPFGVDSDQFRPRKGNHQGGEFVVGIVKHLEPKYGIEYLIRGFAMFKGKAASAEVNLQLVIAGDGALRSQLEQLASELNIREQTIFLGRLSHESVPAVLNRLSVFAATSTLASESFGVAVVEASASGLPVVVSNIGGLPEVVKDRVTGILVPPRDPEAIANALEELWGDAQLRAQLGANGRQFVLENYEWTENASRMERLYESVLAQS